MGKSTAQHLESMGLIGSVFLSFGKKPLFPWIYSWYSLSCWEGGIPLLDKLESPGPLRTIKFLVPQF